MVKSPYTTQQKLKLSTEARQQLQAGVEFAAICDSLNLKPVTLRKWLNEEPRQPQRPITTTAGCI
jgi:hypothetical protein